MLSEPQIDNRHLEDLLNAAKLGWWKADFENKNYICSEYIIKLLGLSSPVLTFRDFGQMIREDYRDRISEQFMSIQDEEVYEQTFPILTRFGDMWIHSRLEKKEKDEKGHLIAWGFIQNIAGKQEIENESALQKINNLLYQQNSISKSLLSFLRTEDTTLVINKILRDILIQFQGSRVYLFEYDWLASTQSCVYEVVAKNISSQQQYLQGVPLAATPWWTKQLTAYSPILLYNLDDLPPEATAEKELLATQHIKSLMVVPLIAKDHVAGYIGIDIVSSHRNWTNEDYQWFSALANIISICIELHRANHKAEKEREYFKNLYEHMPIGYCRLKPLYDRTGKLYDYIFTDLNPGFEEIIGQPARKFLNQKASNFGTREEFYKQLAVIDRTFLKGKQEHFSYKHPDLNKYLRTIIYSTEENDIIVLFSDMTTVYETHEALNKSEKTLRNIYKNIPVGIEIYDKQGFLVDMNDKNIEIFGLKDKNDGIGINIFDNPNIPEDVKQKIRTQEDVNFEIKYNFSGIKEYYPSQQKGIKNLQIKLTTLYNSREQLENYLLILIDNTESDIAKSRIQDFENLFSVIADFAKVGYFKWNMATQKGFAIDQWFKNWGESPDSNLKDVVGKYKKVHPDDLPKLAQFYNDLNEGKVRNLKEEVRVKNENGGWKWIRCNVTVKEYDPEHQNIELIGINFDITELKEIEAKLLEAKNKAETLDKLKSAFLANMSHEIRTPLNAIVGFSNLLAETNELQEKQQYISIIQENNDLLLQLISDILDLSKIEAGTFEMTYGDVDVNLLCQEIVRSFSLKTANGVVLEFEHFEPDCYFLSDRNRLTQVISNFINNALKFTSQGSIKLGYHIRKNTIEFYVSDTGIGIDPDHLHSVFDRFVKLNNFVHGTGLGLSICKSIIEQMGGKIGVISEKNKGSRFWFSLPYTQKETVASASPTAFYKTNSTGKM